MEPFDVDNFISEIQNRPPIWNSCLPEFSNKVLKKNAWEEVCKIFYTDFEEKTNKEKNLAVIELQKKWKSVKDAYNRDKSKRIKSASGSKAKFKKPYVYSKYLSFLDPLSETRPTSQCSNTSTEDLEQDESTAHTNILLPKPPQKKPKKNPMNEDAQEKLFEALTANLQKTSEPENPDKLFLLSLVNDFTAIQDDYKLEGKADIINLIRKYKNMGKSSRFDMQGTSTQYGYQSGSEYTGYQTAEKAAHNLTSSSSLLNLDDQDSATNQSDIITDMYD